jgi:transposase
MMPQEDWMRLQEFRPLADAGVAWTEIARLAGCDPRTAKKYLSERPRPPRYGPRPPAPKLIDPFTGTIDAWLRTSKAAMRASTIYERLVAEPYRFGGSYQRVKEYVARRRPQIAAECGIRDVRSQMHRRFEVAPGSQAQVDWGEEGVISTPGGDVSVYSFHMVLSHSRDPFCRYTTSMDLATFWGCHIAAFAHFGGVPAQIVYDRTKTVVRRHVGRGQDVPLHPEAAAFAAHYGFVARVCWPERPQSKGRVESVVGHTRAHVLAGRTFTDLSDMQRAWEAWLPIRRAQIHRTHGEVIAVRAERDRAALLPIPPAPYLVTERHLRVVGKDALISFEASMYSVPWTQVRPRQRVELRVGRQEVAIFTVGADPVHLATHPRASRKGSWTVDERHWDGLPDGTRPGHGPIESPRTSGTPSALEAAVLEDVLGRLGRAGVAVARRDPRTYDRIFDLGGGR